MAIAKSYFLTAVLGIFGANVFQLLHIPMPWLLGPLLTILVIKLTTQLLFACYDFTKCTIYHFIYFHQLAYSEPC